MVESIIVPDDEQVKPPVLCLCCGSPATHILGDWDVCAEHYNALAAIPFDGIAPETDGDADDYGLPEAAL